MTSNFDEWNINGKIDIMLIRILFLQQLNFDFDVIKF